MKKLKVGIIGCGRISRFHAMPAKAQENAVVKAVCDLIPKRAEGLAKLIGGAKTYTDYEEMIEKEKLDVVRIYSVIGEGAKAARSDLRPIRSPHHTTSAAGISSRGSTKSKESAA